MFSEIETTKASQIRQNTRHLNLRLVFSLRSFFWWRLLDNTFTICRTLFHNAYFIWLNWISIFKWYGVNEENRILRFNLACYFTNHEQSITFFYVNSRKYWFHENSDFWCIYMFWDVLNTIWPFLENVSLSVCMYVSRSVCLSVHL